MKKETGGFKIKSKNTAAYIFVLFIYAALIFVFIAACKKENPQVSATIETTADINDNTLAKNEVAPILGSTYIRSNSNAIYNMPIISTKEKIHFGTGDWSAISVDNFKLKYWVEVEVREEYDVVLETVSDLVYINFYYDGNFMKRNTARRDIAHGLKRYLALYNNSYVLLYDETNESVNSFQTKFATFAFLLSKATATSELSEGDTVYSADNVVNRSFLQPWVEGVEGSGIGEKITLSRSEKAIMGPYFYRYNQITISNGFVDYNRPYLYDQNNRVKKIRISRGDPDEYVDFELKDTPQLQYFNFHDNIKTRSDILEIEILEVYRGSRHDDTCINFIIPLGYLVNEDEEEI